MLLLLGASKGSESLRTHWRGDRALIGKQEAGLQRDVNTLGEVLWENFQQNMNSWR